MTRQCMAALERLDCMCLSMLNNKIINEGMKSAVKLRN